MGKKTIKKSQSCRNGYGEAHGQSASMNSGLSVSQKTENRNKAKRLVPIQLSLPFMSDDSLCAAGNRWNDNTNNVGNNGNYWSSTQNPNNSNNAYNLNFNSGNANTNNNNRTNGQSVRSVTEFTKDKKSDSIKPTPFIISKQQLLVDLIRAYYDARRNKRKKPRQIRFEINMENELVSLRDEIIERNYESKPSSCFIIKEPKLREIFAADFRDRVVHHLLYNYISDIINPSLIDDCYSCRIGKGTTYGIERLYKHIHKCSYNFKKECYILKMDIKGYFMNINRPLLLKLVCEMLDRKAERKVKGTDKKWIETVDYDLVKYLCKVIILNNPIVNCIKKGKTEDWESLPKSKSLFHSPEGCGLPIGNLTSQLFSNVYLNGFDHFMKRNLKCKHYGRYVDDFYVVSRNRDELLQIRNSAEEYLQNELGLKVNQNKTVIRRVMFGIDFLGAFIKPHRLYLRNSTLNKMVGKIRNMKDNIDDYSPQNIRDSLNSFFGLMKRYKTYRIRERLFEDHYIWDTHGIFQRDYSKFYSYKQPFYNPPHTLFVER